MDSLPKQPNTPANANGNISETAPFHSPGADDDHTQVIRPAGRKRPVAQADQTDVLKTRRPAKEPAQAVSGVSAAGSLGTSPVALTRLAVESRGTNQVYNLESPIILLGRAPTCHIPLDAANKYVSRIHAVIHVLGDRWLVEDNGSVNGTLLNGTRLVAHRLYPFGPDDRLNIEDYSIQLV